MKNLGFRGLLFFTIIQHVCKHVVKQWRATAAMLLKALLKQDGKNTFFVVVGEKANFSIYSAFWYIIRPWWAILLLLCSKVAVDNSK